MVLSLTSKHLWLTAHSPAAPIDIIMIPPSTCARLLDDGTVDIVFVHSEHRSVLLCKLVHPGLLGLPFSSHTAKSFRPSAMALQWKHAWPSQSPGKAAAHRWIAALSPSSPDAPHAPARTGGASPRPWDDVFQQRYHMCPCTGMCEHWVSRSGTAPLHSWSPESGGTL